MLKNILFKAICWIAVVAFAGIVKAQDVDRSVNGIDVSVHAGIEEETLQPENSQKSVKKQTTFASWTPGREKQSSSTSAQLPGVTATAPANRSPLQPVDQPPTPAYRSADVIDGATANGGKSKQPDLFNGSPIQHRYSGLTYPPKFKAVAVSPSPEPNTYESFKTFDRKPLGLLNDYSLLRTNSSHRESSTTNLGKHKVRRLKSVDDHHPTSAPSSRNTVTH